MEYPEGLDLEEVAKAVTKLHADVLIAKFPWEIAQKYIKWQLKTELNPLWIVNGVNQSGSVSAWNWLTKQPEITADTWIEVAENKYFDFAGLHCFENYVIKKRIRTRSIRGLCKHFRISFATADLARDAVNRFLKKSPGSIRDLFISVDFSVFNNSMLIWGINHPAPKGWTNKDVYEIVNILRCQFPEMDQNPLHDLALETHFKYLPTKAQQGIKTWMLVSKRNRKFVPKDIALMIARWTVAAYTQETRDVLESPNKKSKI